MVVKQSTEKVENKGTSTLYVRCKNPEDWNPVLAGVNTIMAQLEQFDFSPAMMIPHMTSKTTMSENGPVQELLIVKLEVIPTAFKPGVAEHFIKDLVGTITKDIKDEVIITTLTNQSDITKDIYFNNVDPGEIQDTDDEASVSEENKNE